MVALGYRILELANKFEDFALKLVCRYELERPLKLAQEAVGITGAIKEVYCPFPDCLELLLSPGQYSSSRASSSNQSDISCVECQECRRLVCASCVVPWHSSLNCEEYQSLPAQEREAGDATLLRLAQNNNWRRCQQCRRVIELAQGCYRVTCWYVLEDNCFIFLDVITLPMKFDAYLV